MDDKNKKYSDHLKKSNLIDKMNYAIEGIIEAIILERNMKIHFFVTLIIIFISLLVGLNKIEFALILIAIALVWITEIINTAIEKIVDMNTKEYNEYGKIAKDAGAGAVFVSAILAIAIGYLVFYNHFEKTGNVISKFKNKKFINIHHAIIILLLVLVIVIGLKAFFKKGRPLDGGMPSGHSAAAFSIATSIFFISQSSFVGLLAFGIAMLVAQSRVRENVHTVKEVIIGSFVGFLITFLSFYILLSFTR